jgi:rhodanese-related sulfurtransferase
MISKLTIIGTVVGAIGGFLYWKYVGCASGTCAITSNKFMSMAYGALLGSFALQTFSSFINKPNSNTAMYQNISAADFQQKMKEPNVEIIDVRTSMEVSMGYIKGTQHFIDVSFGDFEKKIEKLDKDKTYLVYCRSGNRSSTACNIMAQRGFKNLYNLSGGIGAYKGEIVK